MSIDPKSAVNAFDDEARIARMVERLSEWVRVESPTRNANAVNAMMDVLVSGIDESIATVERVPGRDGLGDSVILRAGPQTNEKPILVLSHLDTVHPIGTAEKDNPVRREGDRLYGPGVYDMKGGACLALEAFMEVARRGTAKRPLVFLFTPDEEIGSLTTRGLIEELGRHAEAVLVTEPAREGGKIVTSRKGVGRFDVHIEGRPAHSGSKHAEGRNAIHEAARQISVIEAMTDYERGVTTTVGLVNGGTAMNTVPQHCRFSIDLRVATVADGEEFAEKIMGLVPLAPDFKVTVTGGMNRPPFERTQEVAQIFTLAQEIGNEIGLDVQECPRTGGGSDGNFTAIFGVPTLDGLGIDGDGAHTLQEYALISSIAPRAKLIASFLERIG
ncbi:MAG: glutamate carboxypeptidase [Saliniramus fredricksonii]|uniref:Glutamate carboxypeptidase n=1 Tax=Saliniramus fredricksonii TaxID=1653334 RepID=A0A0P7XXC4_9HYPH|nr:M20 family metallopeptidase [Saliniramus fredricksonii]KPQ12247.1 MAG: glutamate carboxypeptidase [Saliniramus fredricksonii]SCC78942.1 glutamate carboxypeptidase [Saliniramus fredricksonii]